MDNTQTSAEASPERPGPERGRTLPTTDDLQKLKRQRTPVYFNGSLHKAAQIEVTLKVVTPILGGSYKVRHIDDVDIIRSQSVRPNLRFWWRALYAHKFPSAAKLYEEESKLWGRAADDKGGGRSAVEVRIAGLNPNDDIDNKNIGFGNPDAYALWPARRQNDAPVAERRKPGTFFQLILTCPQSCRESLEHAICAWVLFGGYGSRTRRGLGSLTITGSDADSWLPHDASAKSLASVFGGEDMLAACGDATVTPRLAGASLLVGSPLNKENEPHTAGGAWTTAVDWLREFRQGHLGPAGSRAREPGQGRPSISNWPEPDKIRHNFGMHAAHPPRREHTAEMAWPRGAFGLPIGGEIRGANEPGRFELRWRSVAGEHSRLASPLVVKALPLAGGRFAPCALWLNRTPPDGARVGLAEDVLVNGQRVRRVKRATEAKFEPGTVHPLLAPGDTPLFAPLGKQPTLRHAFCDWLATTKKIARVAP